MVHEDSHQFTQGRFDVELLSEFALERVFGVLIWVDEPSRAVPGPLLRRPSAAHEEHLIRPVMVEAPEQERGDGRFGILPDNVAAPRAHGLARAFVFQLAPIEGSRATRTEAKVRAFRAVQPRAQWSEVAMFVLTRSVPGCDPVDFPELLLEIGEIWLWCDRAPGGMHQEVLGEEFPPVSMDVFAQPPE